jgi:hypothetical protein
MKLVKKVSKESGTEYTEFTDGSNTFIYEDDVLVRVITLSFDAVISNSDNSLSDFRASNETMEWLGEIVDKYYDI